MKEGDKHNQPQQKHGLGFNPKNKNKGKKKIKNLQKEDLVAKKAEEQDEGKDGKVANVKTVLKKEDSDEQISKCKIKDKKTKGIKKTF